MTDTLRNMPRYIRNTDAFGWQGADGPNGPWRSITPPQNGTPWQTVIPMNELRQTRDEVSGVDALNPSQPVVWDAAWQLSPVNCKSHEDRRRQQIAAALRAAAQQLPDVRWDGCIQPDTEMSIGINWSRDALHAIAAELEGSNG